MFTISRRNLITAAVLTAVTSPAWAKTQTINTDIVIIGGGLGGLSAGSTAVKHGARVVVLENWGFSAAPATSLKVHLVFRPPGRRPTASTPQWIRCLTHRLNIIISAPIPKFSAH